MQFCFFQRFKIFVLGMCLPECMSMDHMSVQCPGRPEEDIRVSGTGVTNGCKPPCGLWDLNLGLLEEQ